MKSSRSMAACLALLAGLALAGGPARAGTRLTLPEALKIALEGSPDLALASVQSRQAQVSVSIQENNFLPTVSAGMDASRHLENGSSDGQYVSAGASVSARYNLYRGGGDRASLEGAKLERTASEADYQRQRQAVLFNVLSAYLSVLSLQDQVKVREEELTASRSQLDRVEAFYRSGSRPVTDLYQQKAATGDAELQVITARKNLQVGRIGLLNAMGLKEDAVFELAEPALDLDRVQPLEDNLPELFSNAMQRRPDIAAQRERISAAGEGIRGAGALSSPSVDLVGSVSTGYSSLQEDSFWRQMGDESLGASVGINLSLPLFDAHMERDSVRRARLALENERTVLLRMQQVMRLELGQALEDFRAGIKRLEVSQARLVWAERALQSVAARYEAGAANLVELNDARSVAVTARYDLVDARFDTMTKAFAVAFHRGDVEDLIKAVVGEEGDIG